MTAVKTLPNITSRPASIVTPPTKPLHPPQPGNATAHMKGEMYGTHTEAANAVVSLILVIMVGFVVFMTIFFWRKYKHITLSVPTYQYSRLSQTDGEAELAEVVDHLSLSLGNSSSDDELEPATLPVSTCQYPGPPAVANGYAAALRSALLEDSDEELLQ